MVRDRSHEEFLERWAEFVKKDSGWREQHRVFLNSMIVGANERLEKIRLREDGEEVIGKLRRVRWRLDG